MLSCMTIAWQKQPKRVERCRHRGACFRQNRRPQAGYPDDDGGEEHPPLRPSAMEIFWRILPMVRLDSATMARGIIGYVLRVTGERGLNSSLKWIGSFPFGRRSSLQRIWSIAIFTEQGSGNLQLCVTLNQNGRGQHHSACRYEVYQF